MRKRLFLWVLLILLMLGCSPEFVQADNPDIANGIFLNDKNITLYYYGNNLSEKNVISWGNENSFYIDNIEERYTDLKVESSDPKILEITNKELKGRSFRAIVKGTGKVKIKVYGTYSGKRKTVSTQVNIIKYKNPAKFLKLGKQDFSTKFKNTAGVYKTKMKEGSYRLGVKSVSGIRIKEMLLTIENGKRGMTTAVSKIIKNSSNICIEKGQKSSLLITFYNSKTKTNQILVVEILGK